MCFICNVLSSDCIKEKTPQVSFKIEHFIGVGVLVGATSMLYYTIKISVKMISLWWSAKKRREKIKKEYDVELLENNNGLYDICYHLHNNDGNFNSNEETDYDENIMSKVEDAQKDLIVVELDRIKEIIVINKNTKKLLLSIGLMIAFSTVFVVSHKKEEMMK